MSNNVNKVTTSDSHPGSPLTVCFLNLFLKFFKKNYPLKIFTKKAAILSYFITFNSFFSSQKNKIK